MDRKTDDDVLDAVGPRLRALRRDRGITLADLAATTGVSESSLSRPESGRRRPSLERCCRRPASTTFRWTTSSAPRAPATPGSTSSRSGGSERPLCPCRGNGGGVHAFKMVIPAQPEPLEPTPQTHEGFEWLYLLNGRLRLMIGERDLMLPPGEAAEFDTSLPHWPGRPTAQWLSFSSCSACKGCVRTYAPALIGRLRPGVGGELSSLTGSWSPCCGRMTSGHAPRGCSEYRCSGSRPLP
jgi:DNA-binding XRE family transcriptional regulator